MVGDAGGWAYKMVGDAAIRLNGTLVSCTEICILDHSVVAVCTSAKHNNYCK